MMTTTIATTVITTTTVTTAHCDVSKYDPISNSSHPVKHCQVNWNEHITAKWKIMHVFNSKGRQVIVQQISLNKTYNCVADTK